MFAECECKQEIALRKNNRKFWGRYAKFYDAEVQRFSGPAYDKMIDMMSGVLTKEMDVLEIATGTGLIAAGVAPYVRSIQATDYSPPCT